MQIHKIGIILLVAAFLLAACASLSLEEKADENTADHYYNLGLKHFSRGHWSEAILNFEQVTQHFPFSRYAIPSELKIAEANFCNRKFIESVLDLQRFQEMHPSHPRIPYVHLLKGTCYYRQMLDVDQDQSNTRNTVNEFEALLRKYPTSPYAEEAEDRLDEAKGRLAEHDFYIGRFYYRAGNFQAATHRFDRLNAELAEVDFSDRIQYYLGKSLYFAGEDERSVDVFRSLLESYPQSEYRGKAEPFLSDLEGGRHTTISKYRRLKERLYVWFGYE